MDPKVNIYYYLGLKREWLTCAPSQRKDMSPAELGTLRLLKQVRSLLNKVTAANYEYIAGSIEHLAIHTAGDVKAAAKLLYDKAVDEQCFSDVYARMCPLLLEVRVAGVAPSGNILDFNNLLDFVIHFSQLELEYRADSQFDRSAMAEAISTEQDPVKKKELWLMEEEQELVSRGRAVGNAKFVGELFNVGILSFDIIHRCIRFLLRSPDQLNIECACKLLATIGKAYSEKNELIGRGKLSYLVQYMNRLAQLVKRLGPDSLSVRVRYMVDDVTDLWRRSWVHRLPDWGKFDDLEPEVEADEAQRKRVVKVPQLWLHV